MHESRQKIYIVGQTYGFFERLLLTAIMTSGDTQARLSLETDIPRLLARTWNTDDLGPHSFFCLK